MAHTSSIMDAPIKEINVPVMKPTKYTPKIPSLRGLTRRYMGTLGERARRVLNRFADWILSIPNEPVRGGVNEMEAPLRGFLRTYRIDGIRGQDQNTFTNHVRDRVVDFFQRRQRPFQVKFIFTCKFQKGATEEEKVDSYGHFHTHVERVMEGTDLDELYERMIKECLEKIEKFQKEGSGWKFASVVSFDINVDPFTPMRGNSYFPLPYKLEVKKAIVNVKNDDNECFKWAVSSAVFPSKKNGQRLTAGMRYNAALLNWKGIDFPTPLQQISRFEKQNPYSINVYGWTGTSVYPLRISKHDNEQCINLMLLEKKGNHHYCWIKNMSRLSASQYNKHKGKRFVCKYCCNSFQREVTLQKHIEYCSKEKVVKVVMPRKGEMLSFKNNHGKMRVPFVVYADFECFTRPISTCAPSNEHSYTQQYQKHKPCSYSYYIKCFDDELFPPVLKRYTIEDGNINVAKSFVRNLEEDIVDIYDQFKSKKRIKITEKEERDFQEATVCHICKSSFGKTEDEIRVRDHCHLTGLYRGAAHNKCNIRFKLPRIQNYFMQSKNNFESDFFKLMNNSVFGKTIENIRNRVDIKLVTTPKQAEKYIYRSNYTGRTTFSDDLVAIHMGKTSIYMNKPIYLGMCILGISKTLMYDFYYGLKKKMYGDKVKLLFTDTDSLMFVVEAEDFYKDIAPFVHEWFDTSNFPKEHPSGITTGVNKKVIGMFKDEVGGKIITEFVGLRAKNYSYVCYGKEYKKCKGIKKSVIEKDIHHEDYVNCLFKDIQFRRKMNVFRSRGHDMYTEEVNKIALSANDDKRIILEDGIHTRPHGWLL